MGKAALWVMALVLWSVLGSVQARQEAPPSTLIASTRSQGLVAAQRLPQKEHELYARVVMTTDRVVHIAGAEILSSSAWLPYLLPGMWICAHGFWRNKQFIANKVDVVEPTRFTYYLGPASSVGLGSGWVQAWYVPRPQGGVSLWYSRKVAPANRAVLLAYHSLGIPGGLQLPAHTARAWIRAEGTVRSGLLVWQSVLPFAAGSAN